MSENEKKYYLNIQAGANQSQNLAALMRNYGTAIKATADAENEQNSAAKENARYMESIEGKLQNLKSAWENFSRTMVSSDLVKDGIDALTKGLDFLASDGGQALIKTAGYATMAYLSFKPLMSLFSTGRALLGFKRFGKETKVVTKALKGGGKHIDDSARAFKRLTRAAGSATPEIVGMTAGLGSLHTLLAVGGVGFGLLGAAGITAGILALNKAIDGTEDPAKKYKQLKNEIGKLKDKIAGYNEEIQKLEKKGGKGNKKLSGAEKQRLAWLKEQTAELKKQVELKEKLAKDEKKKKIEQPQNKDPKVQTKVKGTAAAVGKGSSSILKQMEDSEVKQKGYADELITTVKHWQEGVASVGREAYRTGKINKDATKDFESALEKVKKKQKDVIDTYGGFDKLPPKLQKSYKAAQDVEKGYKGIQKTLGKLGGEDWSTLTDKQVKKATSSFKQLGEAIGVSVDESGDLKSVNYNEFIGGLQTAGFTADQARDALIALGNEHPEATFELDGVEVAGAQVEQCIDFLDKLNGNDPEATVTVDGVEYAVSEIGSLENYMRLVGEHPSTAKVEVQGADEVLAEFIRIHQYDMQPKIQKVSGDASGAKKAVKEVNASKVKEKTLTVKGKKDSSYNRTVSDYRGVKNRGVTLSVWASVSGTAKKLMSKLGFAKGTKNAPEGLAEVNEQGYEFIRDAKTGKLRVAGGGKRTITHLNEGDTVYTHQESKRMISDQPDIEIPQHKKGKKGKKAAKKLKKAQDQYNKKVEGIKNEFNERLRDLKHQKEVEHWTDAEYQKRYNALYKQYNNRIKSAKATNKKVKKVTTLGKDAQYEIEEARADLAHDVATRDIDKLVNDAQGTDKDLQDALNRIKKEQAARNISEEEAAEYQKQAYRQHIEYNMKLFDSNRQLSDSNKKTYADMRKELDSYYNTGKLTAAEYYDYLQDLVEKQFERQKEILNKQKEKTENTYSLAKAYVNRQISALEKQNEAQQEQNELIEKQNDLMKAQSKLVRVYREGKGFVYEKDTEAIKEATKALKEYQQQEDSPELKAWKEVLELFDEMDELAEIKNLEQMVGGSTSELFGSLGTNLAQWTEWIKENLATSMGLEGLLNKMEEITSYEDMQDFLQGANDTISDSQILSAISKYRFASGTSFVPHTGFARVAEQGYEIALLGKGDAVMPHNISKNLMDWGNYSPLEFAEATSDNGGYVYNFDKLVLPNVANANDFMRELQQLPNRAIQFGTSRA
jgi:hypothetical protein